MSEDPSELESLINAALVMAASEWDPDCALPRGRMVSLGTRDVMRTLKLHGYLLEDPKHRGPSYERGFRDGYLACRAGVPNPTEENNRG